MPTVVAPYSVISLGLRKLQSNKSTSKVWNQKNKARQADRHEKVVTLYRVRKFVSVSASVLNKADRGPNRGHKVIGAKVDIYSTIRQYAI